MFSKLRSIFIILSMFFFVIVFVCNSSPSSPFHGGCNFGIIVDYIFVVSVSCVVVVYCP